MGQLEGKIAVVTGSAVGIGKECATLLAREGAAVVIADTNTEEGQQTAHSIQEWGGEALFVETDVRQEESIRNMIETTLHRFEGLDILHNNAGVEGQLRPVHDYDQGAFDEVYEVNLKGTFLCIKHGVRAMRESGGGSIINTASVGAWVSFDGILPAYSATKAGILALGRSAAVAYAEEDIRVNAVAPGTTDAPMYHRFLDILPNAEEVDRQMRQQTPMGGLQDVEDVAQAVLFLSSDAASRITGQVIVIDGGYTSL